MMVVAHDGSGILGRSGIERYAREVLKELPNVAPDITVRLLIRRNRTAEHQRELGTTPLREIREVMPHDLMLGRQLVPVTRKLQQRQWTRETKDVDLVHFVEGGRWLPKVPRFVVTIHDLFPLDPQYGATGTLVTDFPHMVDAMASQAKAILVPSHYVKGTIIERYPETKDRIYVTHLAASSNFIPMAMTSQTAQVIGHTAGNDKYLFFVGRIDPRKNLVRQLEAYVSLPESTRKHVSFVLALSGDMWEKKKFLEGNRHLVNAVGVKILTDVTSLQLVELLSNARAVSFATLGEGFGLPVLEAMRCGAPVITSNLSSLPEVAGECAIYVNPYDVQGISEAMQLAIENDDVCSELRTSGIEQAAKFSWANTARQTAAAYRSAMERS